MIIVPYLLAALVGLVAGWLTNIIAERFPLADRPLFGSLHCVRCNQKLAWRDHLPIVGFLLQRGKCRYCSKALPWRFPIVELALTLAFPLAYPLYASQPLYVYLVNCFYIFLLAVIGLIDWRYRLIFPVMIYGGCIFGIILALVAGPQPDPQLLPDGLGSVAIGAAIDGGIFLIIYWVAYAVYRRRAMGWGDVLLAILIGVTLGYPRAVSALFLGAVLGGLVAIGFYLFGGKRRRDFIPYGTTLCIGVILILIWGQAIWNWGPFGVLTILMQVIFRTVMGWFGVEVY